MQTGETCPRTHFILVEIIVLVEVPIPPAPAVPTSTGMPHVFRDTVHPWMFGSGAAAAPPNRSDLHRGRVQARPLPWLNLPALTLPTSCPALPPPTRPLPSVVATRTPRVRGVAVVQVCEKRGPEARFTTFTELGGSIRAPV